MAKRLWIVHTPSVFSDPDEGTPSSFATLFIIRKLHVAWRGCRTANSLTIHSAVFTNAQYRRTDRRTNRITTDFRPTAVTCNETRSYENSRGRKYKGNAAENTCMTKSILLETTALCTKLASACVRTTLNRFLYNFVLQQIRDWMENGHFISSLTDIDV